MEMKLLASQINPHFLYNTLETIRMKAFSQGNRDVANAIKLLGKSMRYVLSNTKTAATTLDKELDYIDTYLAIQKIRFGSRIDYSIRVSPKLEKAGNFYRILPLLIQPVVENAISHGIEDTGEDGNLILHLDPSPDMVRLIIKVFDNGCGMSPELETKVKRDGSPRQGQQPRGRPLQYPQPDSPVLRQRVRHPPEKPLKCGNSGDHHHSAGKYTRGGIDPMNVLIADDEQIVLEGLKYIIDWNALGFTICATAVNGEEALEKILALKPDLCLMDIKMPKKNGIEVVQAAVDQGYGGKFIILSGLSDFKMAQTAMRYGVDFYLTKPIDEEELEKSVRTCPGAD